MGYYGLSVNDFDTLMESQNNCCAICKKTCITGRSLSIDHDHNTNKVRGLLCIKCNQGLGFFNDSIDLLQGAMIYLTQHSE
jgi:hypothetical protein